jgi:hypothetical protein
MSVKSLDASQTRASAGAPARQVLRPMAAFVGICERAGLFAAIFVVCYLAFGLPAIVAGRLVAPLGVLSVAAAFGAVIAVAAAIGLGGQVQLLRER